jgi:hypothetical protein
MSDSFAHILFMFHADMSQLNESPDGDSNRNAECLHTRFAVLNSERSNDFVAGVAVMFKDICVSHVSKPDKVCFQLVVMVMVNPGFPQHFTNLFRLLPMSLFKVESTHNFHCDQCFMMADLDSALLTVMISSNNSHGSERAHEQNRVI